MTVTVAGICVGPFSDGLFSRRVLPFDISLAAQGVCPIQWAHLTASLGFKFPHQETHIHEKLASQTEISCQDNCVFAAIGL